MGYIPLKDRPILCGKCKFFKRGSTFFITPDKCLNNKVWVKHYNQIEEWFDTDPYTLNSGNDCKGFESK